VVKGGVIAYAQMGDPNASIPTPEPVIMRYVRPCHLNTGHKHSNHSVIMFGVQAHVCGSRQGGGQVLHRLRITTRG
jgi:urease alpha subunit